VPTATGSGRVTWARRVSAGAKNQNRLGRLCPPYEPVNLSVFSILDPSQMKDLAGLKNAKAGMIHILYDASEEDSLPG
jgi:hypothetical protein